MLNPYPLPQQSRRRLEWQCLPDTSSRQPAGMVGGAGLVGGTASLKLALMAGVGPNRLWWPALTGPGDLRPLFLLNLDLLKLHRPKNTLLGGCAGKGKL